ncbi:MAG: hypothetical protein ACREPI_13065, partial [Candidatus Dormibacterales bacterium]
MARRRGHGEGGVFRRQGDGLCVAMLDRGRDEAGRRVRRSFYAKTRREAHDKVQEVLHAHKVGALPASGKLTVRNYLENWLEAVSGKSDRPPSPATRHSSSCTSSPRSAPSPW